MKASMHGFGTESAADIAPVRASRAARKHPAVQETNASALRHADCQASSPRTARLEHALFALVLGCLGYVWLGALLAEAAQAL